MSDKCYSKFYSFPGSDGMRKQMSTSFLKSRYDMSYEVYREVKQEKQVCITFLGCSVVLTTSQRSMPSVCSTFNTLWLRSLRVIVTWRFSLCRETEAPGEEGLGNKWFLITCLTFSLFMFTLCIEWKKMYICMSVCFFAHARMISTICVWIHESVQMYECRSYLIVDGDGAQAVQKE